MEGGVVPDFEGVLYRSDMFLKSCGCWFLSLPVLAGASSIRRKLCEDSGVQAVLQLRRSYSRGHRCSGLQLLHTLGSTPSAGLCTPYMPEHSSCLQRLDPSTV